MLSPKAIIDLSTGYWSSRAFLAAVKLGFFDKLGSDGQPFSRLANLLGTDPTKLRLLCGVLAEYKLITWDGGEKAYVLPTPLSSMYLNPDSPAWLGPALRYASDMYPVWDRLEERLKSDAQFPPTPGKQDTPGFLAGMHARASMIARSLLPLLKFRGDEKISDIAAGAGTWSGLIHKEHPGTQLTLLEQPEIFSGMQSFCQNLGLADANFISADYHSHTFAGMEQDVLRYFGALHQEREEDIPALISHFAAGLRPGGRMLILDLFHATGEEANIFAYLFGLNMCLVSNGGVHGLETTLASLEKIDVVDRCHFERVPGPAPYYLIEVVKKI